MERGKAAILEEALRLFKPSSPESKERAGQAVEKLVTDYLADVEKTKALPKKEDAKLKPCLRKVRTGAKNLRDALNILSKDHPGTLDIISDSPSMEALALLLDRLHTEAESRLSRKGTPGQQRITDDRGQLCWCCFRALELANVEPSSSDKGRGGNVLRLVRAVHELATGTPPDSLTGWGATCVEAIAMMRRGRARLPMLEAEWDRMVQQKIDALKVERTHLERALKAMPERYQEMTWGELKRAMTTETLFQK